MEKKLSGDFELRHWRPLPRPKSLTIPPPLNDGSPLLNGNGEFIGYTSLSDFISPSNGHCRVTVSSPSSPADIRIRNRLLKQAAYAYLQATPSSSEGSSRRHRRRGCCSFFGAVIGSCVGFIGRLVSRIRIRKSSGL